MPYPSLDGMASGADLSDTRTPVGKLIASPRDVLGCNPDGMAVIGRVKRGCGVVTPATGAASTGKACISSNAWLDHRDRSELRVLRSRTGHIDRAGEGVRPRHAHHHLDSTIGTLLNCRIEQELALSGHVALINNGGALNHLLLRVQRRSDREPGRTGARSGIAR